MKSKTDPKIHDFSISENVTPLANLEATERVPLEPLGWYIYRTALYVTFSVMNIFSVLPPVL